MSRFARHRQFIRDTRAEAVLLLASLAEPDRQVRSKMRAEIDALSLRRAAYLEREGLADLAAEMRARVLGPRAPRPRSEPPPASAVRVPVPRPPVRTWAFGRDPDEDPEDPAAPDRFR